MTWLEIPAHRMLEIEKVTIYELDMQEKLEQHCTGSSNLSIPVRELAGDSRSLDSVTSSPVSD